jgi:thioredoxin-dependent peroxiredoxin
MNNMRIKIAEGQQAPDFNDIIEKDILFYTKNGKWIILYFYAKDFALDCTVEAREFNELISKFMECNAVVIGISRDNMYTHERFKEQECLKFPLISDSTGELSKRYGVWIEKSMLGKKHSSIERTTFLIDSNKIIRRIWKKVNPVDHATIVLNALKILKMLKAN